MSFETGKVYGVFTWTDVVAWVKLVEMCMNNSESKKKLLALQVRVLFTGNSRYIALRNRKTFSRWTPWRSDAQTCHGQQTLESLWIKSALRISAGRKLHRTYRDQFIPQHQRCVQQTTSPWHHFNQQIQGDWYQLSRSRLQGKNIELDLNRRCIDCAELVGPKRLKKNPNFYRCESCQLTFKSCGKSV